MKTPTREIKFRAWDKSNKLMRPVEALDFDIPCVYFNDFGLHPDISQYSEDGEDYDLLQFTGLKDKNGVEIYEGDAVKLSMGGDLQDSPLIVDESNLLLGINDKDSYLRIDRDSLEVIGNIYEERSNQNV